MNYSVEKLIQQAWDARARAYAPYSRFGVGAALVTRDGSVFTGCNVENLSYGLTLCAERVAVGSAVAAGFRQFSAIAVVAETADPISPCGACRQVLAEFGELQVILVAADGTRAEFALDTLLPRARTGILNHA